MNLQKYLAPVAAFAALAWASYRYGFAGFALVAGALVMWVLLHFNRAIQVLKRAAKRPIGSVDSAVMLNARLKAGVSLLHVVTMTRSLGSLQSPKDAQPEIFCWTDGSDSVVTCEFNQGKLVSWTLFRPEPAPEAVAQADPMSPPLAP